MAAAGAAARGGAAAGRGGAAWRRPGGAARGARKRWSCCADGAARAPGALAVALLLHACPAVAASPDGAAVSYSLVAAGKACSNAFRELSGFAGSAQSCAELVCADPLCGNLFEDRSHKGGHCACLAANTACAEMDDLEANRYEITDTSSCEPQATHDCFVMLYENGDFTGWSGSFPEGSFSGEDFASYGALDDGASALYVSGEGCSATVYGNADFSGWSLTLAEGSYSAEDLQGLGAKEKDISAISVFWGAPSSRLQEEAPQAEGLGAADEAQSASAEGRGGDGSGGQGGSGEEPPPPAPPDEASAAAAAEAPQPPPSPPPPETDAGLVGSLLHRFTGQAAPVEPVPPPPPAAAAPPAPAPRPPPPRPPPPAPKKRPPPPRRQIVEDTSRPQWAAKVAAERWQEIPHWARKHLTEERCDPVAKANCDDEELAFIEKASRDICGDRACSREDQGRFDDEAKRLAAKRMDVKPAARPWIERRVALLHGIACRLKDRSEL